MLLSKGEDTFARLRSRFVSAIDSLDEGDRTLLSDAFGLSEGTFQMTRLQDRRAVHAESIRRGVETVADREPGALARLARVLTTGRYAQSPLVLDVPEMHGGLVYESTNTLIVVQDRQWKETIEHYRFMAEFDEMDFLTVTRSYPAIASTVIGGQFRVNTRETFSGFDDHFWSVDSSGRDAPMRRGETYDLRFRLAATEDASATPMVNAYRAFHERSLLASIRVVFLGQRPSIVWKYERVSHFSQPGEPRDSNVVGLDGAGRASLRMRDVYGGLVSGMAWRW